MIFARAGIVFRRATDRGVRRLASKRARRWNKAVAAEPLLAEDLIEMGNVLSMAPVDQTDRVQMTEIQMAYDMGRRDLALEILAHMKISVFELSNMMENDDDD